MNSVYQIRWPGKRGGVFWVEARSGEEVEEATGMRVTRTALSPESARAVGFLDYTPPRDHEALVAAIVALKLTVT